MTEEKKIIAIESINQVREENIRNKIFGIIREILDIGVCRNLLKYYTEALKFTCKLTDFETTEVENRIKRYFKQKMENGLLAIIEALRNANYEIINIDSFIRSIEKELKVA